MQGDRAAGHLLREVFVENGSLHVHIHPGVHRQFSGRGAVGRDTVGNHLVDAGVIRDHEAHEAPLVAQDIRQQVFVRGGGHPVEFVEARHEGGYARVQRGLEGGQVDVAQHPLADVHGVVVPARLGGPVGGEVLGAGQYREGIAEVVALKTTHAGLRHHLT